MKLKKILKSAILLFTFLITGGYIQAQEIKKIPVNFHDKKKKKIHMVYLKKGDEVVGVEFFTKKGQLVSGTMLQESGLYLTKFYYESGEIRGIGVSKHRSGSHRIGEWRFYDENGSLARTSHYDGSNSDLKLLSERQ